MKILLLFALLVADFFNDLNAQIDPLGDIFIGPQPVWSHVTIDSSAIGYKGRTGMDYFKTLAEAKIIVNDKYALLVHDNTFESISGSFIEKIDLTTGKSIWKNAFDLRYSTKREFTNHFYINNQNELELLDFRCSDDILDPFFLMWDSGKLAVRKYDLNSGNQIYEYHSPIQDTNYLLFKASSSVYSHLNRNLDGGYDCYTNWYGGNTIGFGMAKTKMDSFGKFIRTDATNYIVGKYTNRNQYEDIPGLLNDRFDTLVRMIHTFKNSPYIPDDSMELSLCTMDVNLNLLMKKDVSNLIAKLKEYQVLSLKNGYIGILGNEYFLDNSYPRQHIAVFEPNGTLSEEVVYPTRVNDPLGRCFGIIKLRNEPGILVVNRTAISLQELYFSFYKTDGKGNLELISNHKLRDSFNIVNAYLDELDNGRILFNSFYRQFSLNVADYPTTERFITSLWELNIKTGTKGNKENTLNITIIPNPTNENFDVLGFNEKEATAYLINEIGNIVLQKKINSSSDLHLSMAGLPSGMYTFELVGKSNLLLYAVKVIKE